MATRETSRHSDYCLNKLTTAAMAEINTRQVEKAGCRRLKEPMDHDTRYLDPYLNIYAREKMVESYRIEERDREKENELKEGEENE
jgi:hypothetical protein